MGHMSCDFDWNSIHYLLPLEQPGATIILDDDKLQTRIRPEVFAAESVALPGYSTVERAVRRFINYLAG